MTICPDNFFSHRLEVKPACPSAKHDMRKTCDHDAAEYFTDSFCSLYSPHQPQWALASLQIKLYINLGLRMIEV